MPSPKRSTHEHSCGSFVPLMMRRVQNSTTTAAARPTLELLASLFPNLRVDLTGVKEWQHDPWLANLPASQITVDATEALMATSGALCTRIIGVKVMPDERRHYYIDDGCYGSLSQAQDSTPLPLGNDNATATGPLYASTVWGPTCDGLDRVCPHVELPALRRDDWLVFPSMSGQALGTAFNGFCPPDTVYCVLGYFHE